MGRFKKGCFYIHPGGRCIAVLDEVKTYKWNQMFIIEETDKSGHAISCVEVGSEDLNDKWTEIGEKEFLRNFNHVKPDIASLH